MVKFESVLGKYVRVKVQGVEYRVYFEENGTGIPLVCQHTAGSDGRQWRHLLNDSDVTSKYRVIVPDLPYHGKSLPPEVVEWWKEEYRLTRSFLIDFHVEFNHTLGLEKPVYIGCSMGGHLALDLALECPDEFRAVIGLGPGVYTPARTLQWWHHPRIGNDFRAQAMLGSSAPQSPEKYRRETAWEYSQSAPPVLKGDFYYYCIDHNLTGKLQQIDTSRIAVYLLTGEYEPWAPPEENRVLLQQIKGARYAEMKDLGHFTMSENYEAFKKYLTPILEEIAQAA